MASPVFEASPLTNVALGKRRASSTTPLGIAIFPLINGLHPDMALGIALGSQSDIVELSTVPGITLVDASSISWINAAYWVHENNILTMSMDDISAYNSFLEHSTEQLKVYREHMRPEHYRVFSDLWLYMKPKQNRRFRRLPVRKPNQVKQALLEHEGADNLPENCLPTPVLERRRTLSGMLPSKSSLSNSRAGSQSVDKAGRAVTFKLGPIIAKECSDSEVDWENAIAEESPPATPTPTQPPPSVNPSMISSTHRPSADPCAQPGPPRSARELPDLGTGHPYQSVPRKAEVADSVDAAGEREVTAPLPDQIASRVILLTVAEANIAEQLWVEYGEDWYQFSGLF